MKSLIYIQLLEEGTKVYRPVPAIEVGESIYEIKGSSVYDPEDEIWEFIPGTRVIVERKELNGDLVLVAVKKEN